MEEKKERKIVNDIILIPTLAVIITIVMWGCNALIPILLGI